MQTKFDDVSPKQSVSLSRFCPCMCERTTAVLVALLSCVSAIGLTHSVVLAAPIELEEVAPDEGPQRGRLPDGRAFRVDQDGNQLVDYIAELEVEKEALESRIFALQDKLRVQERGQSQQAVSVSACPAEKVCPAQPVSACPAVQEKSAVQEAPAAQAKTVPCPAPDPSIEARQVALSRQLSICSEDLRTQQSLNTSLERSMHEMRTVLAERDASLQMVRSQIGQLRQDLQAQAQEATRARLAVERVSKEAAVAQASARELAQRSENRSVSTSKTSTSASALESAQSQLLRRISDIQIQVKKRDDLFRALDQKSRALKISPSPTRSKGGLELSKAESAIKNARSFRTLSELSKDIESIERIVSDDIRLIQRLGR